MSRSKNSSRLDELNRLDAHAAARRLLGCLIVRTLNGGTRLSGRIVETESYEETDPAAHSYGGPRGRNQVMYGPAGHTYVYFTYGMHYCVNVVTGPAGKGEAVLIRALEPLEGVEIMEHNRGSTLRGLCNGPAKLTQALAIGPELNGHYLRQPPLILELQPALPAADIITTTRIGITRSADWPQRFYIKDSPWVSKR